MLLKHQQKNAVDKHLATNGKISNL